MARANLVRWLCIDVAYTLNVCYTQKYSPLTITAAPMSRTRSSCLVSIAMTCTAQLTSENDSSSHIKGTLQGDRRDQSFRQRPRLYCQSHRDPAPRSPSEGTSQSCNNDKQARLPHTSQFQEGDSRAAVHSEMALAPSWHLIKQRMKCCSSRKQNPCA